MTANTTYCTPADVALYCDITHDGERAVFGLKPPLPTYAEVESMINDQEEILEDECCNAWGTRTVTITEELHDFWPDWVEAALHLNYANVDAFDTEQGDKLEVWDGTQWVDYIATYTEGRDEDFYVDYQLGKIYFLKQVPSSGNLVIKATYRYNGGSTVPKAVKVACALKVGIFMANSPHVAILFPEGEGEGQTIEDRINRWEKQIDALLVRHKIRRITTQASSIPVR